MSSGLPAIYARQSLDIKNSISIEGQIEVCRGQCADGSAPLVYSDKGYSGKNTDRPEFKRLMNDVEQGKISKVICYRLDRISRSIVDFGTIWQTLSANNVEFLSANERFDTSTPTGRAMLYIIMVFAQLERETIAERVKDNYYQRTRRGMWPGGPAPYGFAISSAPSGKGKALSATASLEVVPEIFRKYAEFGGSLGSVARWLDDQSIPSASKRNAWDTVSVGRLLRHPAYVRADASIYAYYKRRGLIMANEIEEFDGTCGGIIVGKREASQRKYTDLHNHLFALSSHEGVVPSDLFLTVQRKLDTNKQIGNTSKGKYTWLSGLLKCGTCGYGISLQGGSGPYRYGLRCAGHFNLRLCPELHHENIREIEDYVVEMMQKRISEVYSSSTDDTEISTDQAALQAAITACDAKIGNLIQALAEASPTSMSYINQEIERLEAEKQDALSALTTQEDRRSTLAPGGLTDVSSLSFNGKKELANLMISRVLTTDSALSINWKV